MTTSLSDSSKILLRVDLLFCRIDTSAYSGLRSSGYDRWQHWSELGRLAQLARAPRLHRGCRGFESLIAHLLSYAADGFYGFSRPSHMGALAAFTVFPLVCVPRKIKE